ncbi:MAG: sulfite oxidase [Planctomycetales bacterium]|nr:sulfite oxidase [Planctomycetales bacterium]
MASMLYQRRRFLRQASVAAVSSALASRLAFGEEKDGLPTADVFIRGKDKRLIVHNAKVGEIETPLALLREKELTPKELLFVRNNQVLPETLTIEGAEVGDWQVELAGLVDKPQTVKVADLAKLPQEEIELVLQCSGNGRARFAKTVKAEGVQWQAGAMGNVKFKGVRLKTLLDHLGVKIKPEARFIAAEGKDSPVKAGDADFEHSIPLAEGLDRSILALSMNGEAIPKVHGGPVRLITPGYYATMNVKWVSRLRFEGQESTNHHHVGRYRTPLKRLVPGSKFTSTLANSEPNWNMRIKSVIFAPLEGEQVPAGKMKVHGVAWNDGTAKIEAVEISSDGGNSWRRAKIMRPKSPFAWHPWSLEIDVAKGSTTILARAVDALGRTQPLDGSVAWNPAGYAWNGVDAVTVTVGS